MAKLGHQDRGAFRAAKPSALLCACAWLIAPIGSANAAPPAGAGPPGGSPPGLSNGNGNAFGRGNGNGLGAGGLNVPSPPVQPLVSALQTASGPPGNAFGQNNGNAGGAGNAFGQGNGNAGGNGNGNGLGPGGANGPAPLVQPTVSSETPASAPGNAYGHGNSPPPQSNAGGNGQGNGAVTSAGDNGHGGQGNGLPGSTNAPAAPGSQLIVSEGAFDIVASASALISAAPRTQAAELLVSAGSLSSATDVKVEGGAIVLGLSKGQADSSTQSDNGNKPDQEKDPAADRKSVV